MAMLTTCVAAAAIHVFTCITADPVKYDQANIEARFPRQVDLSTSPLAEPSADDPFVTRFPAKPSLWIAPGDLHGDEVVAAPERKLTRREWHRQQRELRRQQRAMAHLSRAQRETVRAAKAGPTGASTTQTSIRGPVHELAYAAPAGNWLSWLTQSKQPANDNYGSSAGYDAVRAAARAEGVDTRLALSIAKIESGGKCGSVSSANAVGVMQIKPATARLVGYTGSASGLRDCKTSAKYGAKYLAYCSNLAGGDVKKTALCYNQGHGTLTSRRYRDRANRPEIKGYWNKLRQQGYRL